MKGIIIVVSAPSGAGKTSICKNILKIIPEMRFSVSYTTRPPRPDEVNGKDYHFIEQNEFRNKIKRGDFVEWAENYGNLYGTSRDAIDDLLQRGYDVLFDVDPQGANQLKYYYPDGIFVFVLPPSIDVLKERLQGRGSEDEAIIQLRFEQTVEEIKKVVLYDYVIFNDTIAQAVETLNAIYIAEKSKRKRLEDKISKLNNRR